MPVVGTHRFKAAVRIPVVSLDQGELYIWISFLCALFTGLNGVR